MGMYDTISIDSSVNLPLPVWVPATVYTKTGRPALRQKKTPVYYSTDISYDPHAHDYQTKDLGQGMDRYRLDGLGLFKREVKTEWVEGRRVKKRKTIKWVDHLAELGHLKEIPGTERWVLQSQLTTTIRFYDFIDDLTPDLEGWIEYEAVIVDGKLHREIKLVESYYRSSKQRKADLARFFAEHPIKKGKT